MPNFAKIAHPLHQLTCKGADFRWTKECETTFQLLKDKLVSSPVLVYPCLNKDLIFETDTSIMGLGAVLSQHQTDGLPHPIAFASRALAPAERNYGITDLETLTVV